VKLKLSVNSVPDPAAYSDLRPHWVSCPATLYAGDQTSSVCVSVFRTRSNQRREMLHRQTCPHITIDSWCPK